MFHPFSYKCMNAVCTLLYSQNDVTLTEEAWIRQSLTNEITQPEGCVTYENLQIS